MLKGFTKKEIGTIFENRGLSTAKRWAKIREEVIDTGIQALIDEEPVQITFQIVYNKIISMSDREIFEHIIESK